MFEFIKKFFTKKETIKEKKNLVLKEKTKDINESKAELARLQLQQQQLKGQFQLEIDRIKQEHNAQIELLKEQAKLNDKERDRESNWTHAHLLTNGVYDLTRQDIASTLKRSISEVKYVAKPEDSKAVSHYCSKNIGIGKIIGYGFVHK